MGGPLPLNARIYDRYRRHGHPQPNHGAHSGERHCARTGAAQGVVCARAALPAASRHFAGHARSGVAGASRGCFCAWVSMALARLQQMPDASQQRRVLAGEDRQESGAGPQSDRGTPHVGLAGADRVGMRTQAAHAGCNGQQGGTVAALWTRGIPGHPAIGWQVVKYINPKRRGYKWVIAAIVLRARLAESMA